MAEISKIIQFIQARPLFVNDIEFGVELGINTDVVIKSKESISVSMGCRPAVPVQCSWMVTENPEYTYRGIKCESTLNWDFDYRSTISIHNKGKDDIILEAGAFVCKMLPVTMRRVPSLHFKDLCAFQPKQQVISSTTRDDNTEH